MKEIEMEKWIVDLVDKSSERVFMTMVEQSLQNPDEIEVLYG